jgi:hypothetical protein
LFLFLCMPVFGLPSPFVIKIDQHIFHRHGHPCRVHFNFSWKNDSMSLFLYLYTAEASRVSKKSGIVR